MRIDYVVLGFWVNAVLALGTLIIAIFAVVQASAAKDNASAAKLNAEILMMSQRPRIAASAHGNPTQTVLDMEAPRIQIELFNRGASPAYDFTYESWIEILPFPFQDFTSSADHGESSIRMVLPPSHDPLVINIPLPSVLTYQQRADLNQLHKYVCLRIYARYRDAFGTNGHANFGFFVTAVGLGFLPKYNDAN